ncbi:DNA-directed DNA polymerase [Tanacetum coccineum]
MEEYMTKTREDYGSGITRPKFDENARFELKGQFLKELCDNTFNGSDNEDANEHTKRVLEIADLFTIPYVTQDQLMLRISPISLTGAASRWIRNEPAGLDVPTRHIFDSKGAVSKMNATDAKKAIQEMADHSQKWHNGTSTRFKSSDTSDGLAAIQAQLNNLGREIKKVNEKVYDSQVRYRASAPGFYQIDNGNPSYKERRQTIEESLSKFMVESAKIHNENSNLIKEIRASMDTAIRNQGASIKALEIQIGQMSKPCRSIFHFPSRFIDDSSKEKEVLGELIDRKESATNLKRFLKERPIMGYQIKASMNVQDSAILKDSLPLKDNDSRSLGEFAHTKLIIELADRTIKHPKGIAENILVGIDKFIFPVDFIVLDMLEDIKVPLIPGKPFLSTAHARIDVFKRKITLRVRDAKIVFKGDNPTSNIIKRDYVLGLRERMELDLEAKLMGEALILNRSLYPKYGYYIELNDLNKPWELRRNQEVDDSVVENIDAYRDQDMGEVIVGKPFCKEVCVKARRFDGCITIGEGNDNVTYQMAHLHPRFRHLTNKQCNKMQPILKVSTHDELNGISHPYQKLKGFYKGVLNLGPEYIKGAKTVEWLTRGHVSMHEME